MELNAVIAGLNALKEPCEVLVTTDSKYVKDGLAEWLESWKKQSWEGKLKDFRGNSPLRTGIFGNSSTLSRPNTRLPSNGLRVTLTIQTTTDATNWRPRQLGNRFQSALHRWATA